MFTNTSLKSPYISQNFLNVYNDMADIISTRKAYEGEWPGEKNYPGKPIHSEIKPFATVTQPKNVEPVIEAEMEQSQPKESIEADSTAWPSLSIENINTTFKVVGDIKEGAKMRIVDDRYMTEDSSYFPSLTRDSSYRTRIISFLRHLFEETESHTQVLLDDIRKGIDVDNKTSELEGMISNMMVFLHRYDTMRNVYKSDPGTYATLGVIRNRFFTFRTSLFRKMALEKC